MSGAQVEAGIAIVQGEIGIQNLLNINDQLNY